MLWALLVLSIILVAVVTWLAWRATSVQNDLDRELDNLQRQGKER